jgi:hypothetical protein
MGMKLMTSIPGQAYWDLVEPYWLPLNEAWDEGIDQFLAKFSHAPTRVGHLYAAHWCQSEVRNGGFYQFFSNTTGLLAPEALKAFDAINLTEWTETLAAAIAYFGSVYPRERANRIAQLPARQRGREWDPFDQLNERFFDWLHHPNNDWNRAADEYAISV